MKDQQIVFNTEDGEVLFYVLADTRVSGVNYLLVSESEDDEAECYILMDTSEDGDEEAVYSMVDDDERLQALSGIFSELLEDTTIE